MPSAYIPVLIFAVLVFAFPAVTLIIMKYIRPDSRPVGAKLKPYECGVPAEGDARGRYSVRFYIIAMLFVIFDVETMFLFPWGYSVRFYIIAMLFVIFDVETMFLFPWAIKFKSLGLVGLISMFVFLGILLVGYIWLYKKGALDWA